MKPPKPKPAKKNQPVKILIVDDHPLLREGVARLINREPDLEVCAEAGNAQEALKAVAKAKPDVAIVDVALSGLGGIELIKSIRTMGKKPLILALSMHDEVIYAERALRAGAQGYLMKSQPAGLIITALRDVLDGKTYLSEPMKERLLRCVQRGAAANGEYPANRLSDCELEIYQMIGEGLKPSQIARRMSLSVKTVESYRARIRLKLNLKNASELVQHCVQWAQAKKAL